MRDFYLNGGSQALVVRVVHELVGDGSTLDPVAQAVPKFEPPAAASVQNMISEPLIRTGLSHVYCSHWVAGRLPDQVPHSSL